MKKIIQFLSLFTVIALIVGISSCKKDDEPPPAKPKLSFIAPTLTVNEADGTIEVEFTLDKPADEDIVVEYSLAGSAKDKASVASGEAFDYEILTDEGEVEIIKGETTGIIEIKFYSDLAIENPETIEIKIEDVDSDNIEVTREDDFEITIEQEDGLVIALDWPIPATGAQADMDILLRVGDNTTTWDGFLTGSTNGSFESPEFIFLPKALEFGAYGVSYVYYDGTLDPLEFTVTYVDLIDGEFEPEATQQVFTATYTAVNKNKWTNETINTTIVVQTFVKSASGFDQISEIAIPVAGSRMRSFGDIPSTLKKEDNRNVSFEIEKTLIKRLNRK